MTTRISNACRFADFSQNLSEIANSKLIQTINDLFLRYVIQPVALGIMYGIGTIYSSICCDPLIPRCRRLESFHHIGRLGDLIAEGLISVETGKWLETKKPLTPDITPNIPPQGWDLSSLFWPQ
jgi:hypothetical protein